MTTQGHPQHGRRTLRRATGAADVGLYVSLSDAGLMGAIGPEHRRAIKRRLQIKALYGVQGSKGKNCRDGYMHSERASFYNWLHRHLGNAADALDQYWFVGDLKGRFEARLRLSRMLYSGGWLGQAWPSAVGGQDRKLSEQIAVYRLFASAGIPTLANWVGIEIVGPVLLKWATEDQKQTYLPRIIRGEHIWCQALTEREAGSDLSKIKTTIKRDGHRIILSGEKIWTSWAAFSDFALVLARTDELNSANAYTFVIVNLRDSDVTIQPIHGMYGECEDSVVRFNNVCLSPEAVVGGESNGWNVLKTSLLAARSTGTFVRVVSLRGALRRIAESIQRGGERPSSMEDVEVEFNGLLTEVRALEVLGARACARDSYDTVDPLLSAAQKLAWARVSSDLFLLSLKIANRHGVEESRAEWCIKEYYRSLGCHVEGGTDEIQRNFIARWLYARERIS